MAFRDFRDIMPDPLRLPINGTVYEVPEVSAADGMRAWRYINTGKLPDGSAAKVEDIARLLLGSKLHRRLIADHIPYVALNRVYTTVIADFTSGRRAAELMWETNGSPKALEHLNPTDGDAAHTTPAPDSTNGTRTSPARRTRES